MKIDSSSIEDLESYVSVPDGTYACRIAEVREGTTRDGSARWAIRLEVAEGDHAGRTAAWDALIWSTRGLPRVKQVLASLGFDVSGTLELPPGWRLLHAGAVVAALLLGVLALLVTGDVVARNLGVSTVIEPSLSVVTIGTASVVSSATLVSVTGVVPSATALNTTLASTPSPEGPALAPVSPHARLTESGPMGVVMQLTLFPVEPR